jgi:DNA sulfur modification protein DndD
MQIKSLTLQNFLGFKGETHIDFEVSDAAPVILFVGKNGSGKTSINHAARWCLYGETKVKGVVLTKENLINRKAVSDSGKDQTRMSVDLVWEQDGTKYDLMRSWTYSPENPNGVFETKLRINDGNPESEAAANEYVQRFIAKEISHFFFFDGEIQEEFDEMMGNSQTAAFIRSQIERTLSIPVLNDAIEWLQSRERQESQSIVRASKDNDKIREKNSLLEKEEAEVKVHEEELSKAKTEHSRALIKLDELDKTLGDIASISSLHDEMNQEKGKISALNEQRRELLTEIREVLDREFWLPHASFLENIAVKVNKSREEYESALRANNDIHNQINLLERLRVEEVCPVCQQKHETTAVSIKEQIERLTSQVQELSPEAMGQITQQSEWLAKIGYSSGKVIRIKNLLREYDDKGAKLAIAERKHRDLRLDMALHGDINVADAVEKVKTYTRDRENAKDNIAFHEKQIKEKKSTIDRLRIDINKAGNITPEKQNAFNAYRYLRSLFEQVKDTYAQLVREQVETFASDAFLEMISQKKFKGLKINENFGVNISLGDGQIEPVASAGQRKISSVALVAGLIKTVSPKSFIFMDTPTVSFDDDHTKSLYKWAGKSGLQVCLFLHTKEFNSKSDMGEFDGRVGKVYRIEMIDETSKISLER